MLVVMNDKTLSRRAVVAGLPLLLAGCSGGYRSITGELYSVPFVSMHPDLMRQEVAYGAPYRMGTVVVNIRERRLYLVQAGGRALRYAVGVGRAEARNFHGSAVIGRKEPWPSWTPTANMMRAMPHYRAYASGMAGGTANALRARGHYLYPVSEDTDLRRHRIRLPPQPVGMVERSDTHHVVASPCWRARMTDYRRNFIARGSFSSPSIWWSGGCGC